MEKHDGGNGKKNNVKMNIELLFRVVEMHRMQPKI